VSNFQIRTFGLWELKFQLRLIRGSGKGQIRICQIPSMSLRLLNHFKSHSHYEHETQDQTARAERKMEECRRIQAFNCGCGHVTEGRIHTPSCIAIVQVYEGNSFFKPGNKCISFSPLKIKPHFIVGKCREYLKVTEKRNPKMDEQKR
jgi:hypothetical protein